MKTLILSVLLLSTVLFSCSENRSVREYGGSLNINREPNEIVLGTQWVGNDLWILTLDTVTNTNYFREYSRHGLWEGIVIIKENHAI